MAIEGLPLDHPGNASVATASLCKTQHGHWGIPLVIGEVIPGIAMRIKHNGHWGAPLVVSRECLNVHEQFQQKGAWPLGYSLVHSEVIPCIAVLLSPNSH